MKEKKSKSKPRRKKQGKHSPYEIALELGLIGCAKGAPKDLSTNKGYFKGFGKDK